MEKISAAGGGIAAAVGSPFVKVANKLGAGIDEHEMYANTLRRANEGSRVGRAIGSSVGLDGPGAALGAAVVTQGDILLNVGRGTRSILHRAKEKTKKKLRGDPTSG